MRRIVVLLTVVALMVVMLAMSVGPAFATWEAKGCRTGGNIFSVSLGGDLEASKDRNGDGFVCYIDKGSKTVYYDNRLI